MNTQQRQQERIRLWEMDRSAAYKMCGYQNDMRLKGCHIESFRVFQLEIEEQASIPVFEKDGCREVLVGWSEK